MTVEELLQKVIIRDISLAQGLMLSKVMFKGKRSISRVGKPI